MQEPKWPADTDMRVDIGHGDIAPSTGTKLTDEQRRKLGIGRARRARHGRQQVRSARAFDKAMAAMASQPAAVTGEVKQ